MAAEIRFKRRASGGATGAPASLKTAEPAYNMADGKLYVGFGDNGSGGATSIKVIAKDDFIGNVPSGGTTGQVLKKNSNTDGDWAWAADQGNVYTASGDGIELNAFNFSLNYTEIATGIGLSNYATTASVTSALAGKADTSHTHSAADITSGVFDIARIPVLPSQNNPIVAASNIASLTVPQQNDISEGTVVTTTDGRRWVYNTGTKTLEASYIELADITPDWSVIANKPSFSTVATSGSYLDLSNRPSLATVATSGAYADLTGRPSLGTLSSQAASAVAITGGTIDNVTITNSVIDGGTF